MDPATLIGIAVAFLSIMIGLIMDGGNPASMILPSALVIVVGGTLGATVATGLLTDAVAALKGVVPTLTAKAIDSTEAIETVVQFADQARREGLLALEEAARSIEDPFLRKGIQLAVDGTDPEELRDILEMEIAAKKAADRSKVEFFAQLGTFGPTMGVIGTIMGLIGVLENLSTPETLGPLIASAFLTTLYGVVIANLVAIPIGKRMGRLGDLQTKHMELVLEGVLSVQAGSNPRTVEQKLQSFLPPDRRAADLDEAA
jgi:chemotaxis protein MotA